MTSPSNRRLARGFVAHLKVGKNPKDLIKMLAAEIVESKKIGKVDLIIAEIAKEIESQMSITNATVYSARELSAATKLEIAKLIKKIDGTNKVIIDEQIDASLLGGVKIETPESEVDLSIRNKLEKIGGHK